MLKIGILLFVISVFIGMSCERTGKRLNTLSNQRIESHFPKWLSVTDDTVPIGTKLVLTLTFPDTVKIDSLMAFIDDTVVMSFSYAKAIGIPTNELFTGKHSIKVKVFGAFNRTMLTSFDFWLVSDIKPKKSKVKIISKFPHDRTAYTQGLEVYKNQLFESTGRNGESTLRKVNIETGEIIQSISLPHKYFAEGITFWEDKIYQLTWETNVCFIYDAKTFQNLSELNYPTEGWGITHNSNELIMSDGSETIYFIDPDDFSQKRKIEVYDQNGPIKLLNELEYINGKIYANVYHENYLVVFDPKSGKVLEYIDAASLIKVIDGEENTDVLNGIAYNPDINKMYLTGKWWPWLFEVEIIQWE